ncbi:MAG: carboxymuconolactone decarboxylase family protein [Gammaproteobacteria bacterium]
MQEIPSEKYRELKKRHHNVVSALETLGQTLKRDGPIDEKTAQLIQLAAAATIHSEGAVHSHTRRALEAGAKPEEIRHALILLTSTIGFPTMVAAMSWADNILNAEV